VADEFDSVEDLDGAASGATSGACSHRALLTIEEEEDISIDMQDLDIKRVITRSSSDSQQLILEKIGIKEILSPEDEVGMAVAQRLLNPDIITFLPLPDEYEIAEISAPSGIQNKTIADVKLREKYNLNLITIKRDFEEMQGNDVIKSSHIVGVPKAETVIFESDTLILMGKRKHIQRFLEVNR
jgi:trk system potassium uptake protein TrkA